MTAQTPIHLCVTHSPLVSRVFRAVASQQGIPQNAIRTISRRGTSFQGIGQCLDELSDEMEQCYRKLDRGGFQACSKRLDEVLHELSGGSGFVAYLPHANKILYQEIAFHQLCEGYAYLEEGFTSMAWSTRRNNRSSWSKILRSQLRTFRVRTNYRFTRPMFDRSMPNYLAAYALSEQAFRGMPGRVGVSTHAPPFPEGGAPGKTYLILDASYLHHGLRWDDYENALVKSVLESSPPENELLVKFHFADTRAEERFESIRKRLAGTVTAPLHLLAGGFPVEENLTRRDLLIFALTSLGYYAALAGGRVDCFAGEIEGMSISSWIADGRLPADFARVVGTDALGL